MWAKTDACLKCTLCITQCPVMTVNPDFPGPKALGPEWYRQNQHQTVEATRHVDDCTFCQLCEQACPVDVPVAHLIAWHKASQRKPLRLRLRDELLARPHRAVRWSGAVGLSGSLRKMGGISQTAHLPRRRRLPAGPLGEPLGSGQGRVGIFVDCYSASYDETLAEQAEQLLGLWGYQVTRVPGGSHCCGAAAYAAGNPDLAQKEARSTWNAVAAFSDVRTIVTLNATCDGTVRDEWPRYFGLELSIPVVPFDEIALAAPPEFWNRLSGVAADDRMMAHTTCRGKVARGEGQLAALARRAGFRVVEPSDAACCGAAGSYAFKTEHEDTARQLGARLAEQSSRLGAAGIVTDSGTCALHIEQATQVTTRHPAYWLYRQYQRYLMEGAP